MRRLWAFGCRIILMMACGVVIFNTASACMQYPALGWMALAAAAWRKARRGWQVTSNYGSARLATLRDIRRKLLCERGLILGRIGFMAPPSRRAALRGLISPFVKSELACRQFFAAFFGRRWAGNDFIRIKDFVHLATFAPAGGGKSVSVIVPNLLSYAGNCVVVDPKGELFKLTAAHRRKKFKHKIVRLDPALLCGPGADCFNPFDFVDPHAKEFIDVCRSLANTLVVRSGREPDPHWNDACENVIAAFIAHVCACEGNPACRNLQGMRTFIASRHLYTFTLDMMRQNEGFHGVLQQLGNSLGWHVDKELGSVMTHAQRHTNIFDSPLVADCTGTTSFDPKELRTGRMTVYLIMPADKLVVWSGLMRMWLGSLLRIITRGEPSERNPVLFLVDECAHIGNIQALEDAITLMRGAGIRIWLFFQSIQQLQKCFGDNAGTVLDNLATQQYFAINSCDTAEAISKRIGEETIAVRTEGGNSGLSWSIGGHGSNGGSRNSGTSMTIAETGRRLLKPEEILVLPENLALVFHKNHPVIMAELIQYYSDKAFRRGGTGRSRGLGLGGMVLSLAALAMSGLVTVVVASLPVPVRHRPWTGAPNRYIANQPPRYSRKEFPYRGSIPRRVETWKQPPSFQPVPFRPDKRKYGRPTPLPYRRNRRSFP